MKLKDLTVTHVSLVKCPANGKKFIRKSDGSLVLTVPIIKKATSNEGTHIVTGIVYEPNSEDLDNDWTDASTIEKAAHEFLKSFRQIDEEHNYMPGIASVVESYVVPSDQVINDVEVKKGTWILSVEPTDETWEKLESGEFTGFSLAGTCTKEETSLEKAVNSIVKSVQQFFSVEKTNDFNTNLENSRNNDIFKELNILESTFYAIQWDSYEKPEEMKQQILNSIDQFRSSVESKTFEIIQKGVNMEELAKVKEQLELLVKSQKELEVKLEGIVTKNAELAVSQDEIKKSLADRASQIGSGDVPEAETERQEKKENVFILAKKALKK